MKRIYLSTLFAILISSVVVATPALAQSPSAANGQGQAKRAANTQNETLAANQQRTCEQRLNNITARSEKMVEHAENFINTFDAHVIRTQEFYTASGVTLSNYEALVADIEAKKTLALAQEQNSQNALALLSCTSGDPKQQLRTFSMNIRNTVQALKEYQTTVRNLIVAVHKNTPDGTEVSAEGSENQTGRKNSPKPAASPKTQGNTQRGNSGR